MTLNRSTLAEQQPGTTPDIDGAAAVALVAVLTRESWELAGRHWPEYSRAETPIVFVPWSEAG